MRNIYLALIAAAGLIHMIHPASAEDYDSGYDAGKGGYYGGKPDNNSSADYYQGYQRGHQQQYNSDSDD